MKKRIFAAAVVMAIWAMGAYTLGRHHGATRGAMEIPSVKIDWVQKAQEAKAEEMVDYVAISSAVCDGQPIPEVQAKK